MEVEVNLTTEDSGSRKDCAIRGWRIEDGRPQEMTPEEREKGRREDRPLKGGWEVVIPVELRLKIVLSRCM